MLLKAGRALIIAALLWSIGGGWQAWQVLAWAQMLQDRVATQSFTTSIGSVLSGENPCARCQFIQREQERERDRSPGEVALNGKPPEIVSAITSHRLLFSPKAETRPHPTGAKAPDSFQLDIPVPPPRLT